MEIEQNQSTILVHWTYNREEWKAYIRWTKRRRGSVRYMIYYLFEKKQTAIPEITITRQKIWVDDAVESFSDINKYVKRVGIVNAGQLNILEIVYSTLLNGETASDEIRIPIPKGKLREAIELQEKLIHPAQ